MSQPTTAITISATGTAVSGPCVVTNLHLAGGSDASTAVIRDGGALGPIRAKLSAAAAGNDDLMGCFRFTSDVYITLTGTSPVATVAIKNSKANQLNPS
jgi:hypothetical protein